MVELNIAGYNIKFGSSAVTIGQLEKHGVTVSYTVYDNGEAKEERCAQIRGKRICLEFKDQKKDKHGVSKIAAAGLGKCLDAVKKAMSDKGAKDKAGPIIAACEAMYAFARSDAELKTPPKTAKAKEPVKPAATQEAKAPEKPLKK